MAARAREFRSRYSGSVASLAPADLAHAVDQLEEIEALSIRTRAYAYLLFSENTDDAAAKALYARTQ